MTLLEEFIGAVNREVDSSLDLLVPAAEVEPTKLHGAVRWSLFPGGKRVRPAILFASGQTFGANFSRLSRSAAAIEMIHTYSLIHDDLPAMDDDDLRRGRATCHRQFGEATAILAGDVLQTLAYKTIVDDDNLSAEVRISLISLITEAAGTPAGMVAGQQFDLDAEGKTLAITEIERIHRRKTGALISVAAKAGAVIGGASESELESIGEYSLKLGLLFQVTDDLLDVTQATEILGKTAGKDAASEKATYPGHFGIEESLKMARAIRDDAFRSLDEIGKNTELLRGLADLILSRTK